MVMKIQPKKRKRFVYSYMYKGYLIIIYNDSSYTISQFIPPKRFILRKAMLGKEDTDANIPYKYIDKFSDRLAAELKRQQIASNATKICY